MASKHYHIKFNFDHDKEIIDRLESKENKNNYIRNLIWSDIAADILRDSIKLEDKEESFDYHQARNDFYYDHCPALNNLDYSINHCDGCEYKVHYKDVDGIEKAACSLEDAWDKYWVKEAKRKLNSIYGKAVSGNG